ncbi:MAG: phospholipase D-like domain-containing protein, partial [Anaerolineae bacterium]|nr:phospholipase D-like domain-containing protein [Anaerolineae bacterium]
MITYTLQVANLGGLTTTGVLLTDTLPLSVTFVAQQSGGDIPFTPTAGALLWHIPRLLPDGTARIVLTAQLSASAEPGARFTNTLAAAALSAATPISELTTANNTASWATSVVAQVPDDQEAELLISGVLYDGYQVLDEDEAIEITNVGTATGGLAGWSICEEVEGELSCRELTGPLLPALTIPPDGSVWLAKNAAAFAASFGFSPTCELDSWPRLTNTGDEVILRDPEGTIADALVYGAGTLAGPAWDGPALTAYINGLRAEEGQILSRRRDETTGLPVPDTDTAADWIQYPDDATTGRRMRYPGWDAGDLFMPLTATEEATLIVGIAPDNAFQVVSETLMRARHTISIETYTLTHPEIVDILVLKAAQGVDVALLLEGDPVGLGDQTLDWQLELHACRRIETAGGRCYFMIHQTAEHIHNRYRYLHAKMIIVDTTWVAVGSQNLTASSLPADDKSNGTLGSRGTVIVTDSPAVAERAATIFALDLDPARHSDILRWNTGYTARYGDPSPDLVLPAPTDGISYTVRFSAPLAISGTFDFEFFTGPDAALRNSDALLGLVNRAGEGGEILVEQMYEHAVWAEECPAGENVRLAAYVDAARRGARVRILLNSLSYIDGYEGPDPENLATAQGLNALAGAEGLDLRAAVGNPTTEGIHNKMVLVRLAGVAEPEGIPMLGFAHISSINGSEAAGKVNREVALQVASDRAYAYAAELFWVDWHLSNPIYFPLIAQGYTPPPPPAPYPVISEV